MLNGILAGSVKQALKKSFRTISVWVESTVEQKRPKASNSVGVPVLATTGPIMVGAPARPTAPAIGTGDMFAHMSQIMGAMLVVLLDFN